MYKITGIVASLFLLVVGSLAIAATTPASQTQLSPQTVNLYSQASTSSKVIEKLAISQRMVPFYHQGSWVKVALPSDGKVGWINKKQFQTALNAKQKPDVQMVFVHVDHNQKGKPTYSYVAYKNGKKLTDKQAKALYQKITQQQLNAEKQAQQFQNNMNLFFAHAMQGFAMPMAPSFPMMGMPGPMAQPVIIIDNHGNVPKAKVSSK